jgi:hypothetical protein
MRRLLIAVMSLTLAATAGFAQARRGGGGGHAAVAGRSFAGGGGYRGGYAGGVARGYAGPGRMYGGGYYRGGYGVGGGVGLGYAPYGPSCYSPYYGAYGCGYPAPYPAYGYYGAPVPRVVVPPVVVGGGWQRFRR